MGELGKLHRANLFCDLDYVRFGLGQLTGIAKVGVSYCELLSYAALGMVQTIKVRLEDPRLGDARDVRRSLSNDEHMKPVA